MTQDSLDDILKTAEHKMTSAVEVLGRDLQSIRTGRATPALLDRIQVDYYGTATPIQRALTWKPLAKLTAGITYLRGSSDCMLAVAERPA